jgi:hypothetical protein
MQFTLVLQNKVQALLLLERQWRQSLLFEFLVRVRWSIHKLVYVDCFRH